MHFTLPVNAGLGDSSYKKTRLANFEQRAKDYLTENQIKNHLYLGSVGSCQKVVKRTKLFVSPNYNCQTGSYPSVEYSGDTLTPTVCHMTYTDTLEFFQSLVTLIRAFVQARKWLSLPASRKQECRSFLGPGDPDDA